MQIYRVPVRDILFVLRDVLDVTPQLTRVYGASSVDVGEIEVVMSAAAEFIEDVVFPLNQVGDREGCRLVDGGVVTPTGFRDAYRRFAEAGWLGLPHDRRHGGQDAPRVLTYLVQEMLGSACVSFADYVGCTNFIYRLVSDHAEEALRERYCLGLTDGRVGAAMCMTEPQCGSDLRLTRTRAAALPSGEYAVSGTKIFISGGDQDLTDDIIYLVLARLPDAPAGTRGLSLFLVPKWFPQATGERVRNGVRALGIEHKLGYAGSSTCTMLFEDARGWLVGEPNRGLAVMLTMVNSLRVLVGGQGLFCAEAAYQTAATYACSRLQGRALSGAKHPELAADPLVVHPDVRRILIGARAFTEGARATYYWCALLLDLAKSTDADTRVRAQSLLGLVTPVLKSVLSEYGVSACDECIQVFGGHGYVTDAGIHQYYRDARIAPIQEGANGILALDLVQRQLLKQGRGAFDALLVELRSTINAPPAGPASRACADELAAAVDMLEDLTGWLLARCAESPDEAGAAGTDYQRVFGLILMGWMWLRMVQTAEQRLADGGAGRAFLEQKLQTARFYFRRVLPLRHSLAEFVRTGAEVVMAPGEEYFG